jgi:AI-2 transport protein TqsA
MNTESHLNSIKNILFAFLFVLVMYLLKELSGILVPLALAILIALMFQPLVGFLQKFKAPKWLIFPTVTIITLLIVFAIYSIMNEAVQSIIENQDFLIEKLNMRIKNVVIWINTNFGTAISTADKKINLEYLINEYGLPATLPGLANLLSSLSGSFVMFFLYYVVLLIGLADYDLYIAHVKGDTDSTLIENMSRIQSSILSYLMIKTLISLFTGILVYVTCLFFDLNFAFFFGFIAFLLNFIPSIGSILATIPPVLMAFIQFDTFQPVILILVILSSIQMVMGNLVEPIITGDRLKLNTLTVIFGLVFWGYIWGLAGMIISIPLLVLLKLIFEHFPDTQIFARIMGSPE